MLLLKILAFLALAFVVTYLVGGAASLGGKDDPRLKKEEEDTKD